MLTIRSYNNQLRKKDEEKHARRLRAKFNPHQYLSEVGMYLCGVKEQKKKTDNTDESRSIGTINIHCRCHKLPKNLLNNSEDKFVSPEKVSLPSQQKISTQN